MVGWLRWIRYLVRALEAFLLYLANGVFQTKYLVILCSIKSIGWQIKPAGRPGPHFKDAAKAGQARPLQIRASLAA